MIFTTDRDAREFRRIRRKLDTIRGGPGVLVTNAPEALCISVSPPNRVGGIAAQPTLFAVKITKTGGADGTSTTQATWSYTVKDLLGVTLGTSVNLRNTANGNRPNGKTTFQSADSYGLAFYDGATLVLWDAGEVPTVDTCSDIAGSASWSFYGW